MVLRKTEKKFKKFGKVAITGAIVGGTLAGVGKAGGVEAQRATDPALEGLSLGAGILGTAFAGSVALDAVKDLRKKNARNKKNKSRKKGLFF